MKKVINLVLAVLTVGTLNAQWTYSKGTTYKSAMTTEDEGATAVLTAIDGEITFWLDGLYYCDENPRVNVYLYKGDTKLLDKEFKASKGSNGDALYINFDLASDTTFMKAFTESETLVVLVYESYCSDGSFGYKTGNTKEAVEYILKP
jgi:hypothetical protein